ncbi:hypothetical protein NLU13_8332 [Sarocladium strictum]|uniref:White collar 1 protein n=1 Tax=Sarocladium strictum TaxID=5046 RepID=A0AA39L538_SARSR|nr:hypothetical protein NLU13_8332 [Sarocladium strictum]
MNGMYSHDQLQQQQQMQQQQQQHKQSSSQTKPTMAGNMMAGQAMLSQRPSLNGPGGSDSLDDIIRSNQSELLRRRSLPHGYNTTMAPPHSPRRMSAMTAGDVMNFGSGNNELNNFQFGQPMNTGYQMSPNMQMDHMGGYMGDPSNYSNLPQDVMGSMMPSTFANMNMGNVASGPAGMSMFSSGGPGNMHSPYDGGQMGQMNAMNAMGSMTAMDQMNSMGGDYSMDLTPEDSSMNATPNNHSGVTSVDGGLDSVMDGQQSYADSNGAQNQQANLNLDTSTANLNPQSSTLSRHVSSAGSIISPQRGNSSNSATQPSSSSDATTPITGPLPREQPKKKTIYSKSGFDMLKALWLVATRKNPKIHLGAVDMSCAFVVCDVNMNDCPIIYVSDNFQNLTGYSRHDIIGQNCRFLQAPDGKVEAGSKREFVDDGAVYNLKKMIHEGREVQQSLINYRKGGKPFLNLLTMIPIPWDTDEIRYFIGFQIDLVECPDAIASGQELGGVKVNYKHSDIGQYIWTPPNSSQWEPENGQTLGVDDVSTLLQQYSPKGSVSDWHKQSWDKMLLENTDDVVHVLSLKGLFLYASPACKKVLEYDAADLVGNSLSSVCHPSDIVPVTRELKDATAGNTVNIVFRLRRKHSGYTWFESHGSLFVEQGKGRKCIILVGRKRPVFALSRRNLEANGGIGDSELWTKLSTSGMFLFVSSNIRSLLDLQPESLIGTSIQDLMRKESRPDFGRAVEKARRGKTVTCKHEVQNRRGQVLQAQTVLYPGDATEGHKPSFLLAQTKLLKASSRNIAPASATSSKSHPGMGRSESGSGQVSQPAGGGLPLGSQDAALASDDNIFDELRTTKCSSWQFELRQMEKVNRILAEELGGLLSNKKKRKRRKGVGNMVRDCANCHTRNTPEWRRGPSGQRDLCNSCGLRWAKQTGRVSPRNSSRGGNANGDSGSKKSASPIHSSPLHKEMSSDAPTSHTNGDGALNANGQPTKSPAHSGSAPSGAASATGVKPSSMMPPPSQPSLHGGVQGSGMTSIREERETSQP